MMTAVTMRTVTIRAMARMMGWMTNPIGYFHPVGTENPRKYEGREEQLKRMVAEWIEQYGSSTTEA